MTEPKQERAEILAQALRENLRRRKAQARTREDDGMGAQTTPAPPDKRVR